MGREDIPPSWSFSTLDHDFDPFSLVILTYYLKLISISSFHIFRSLEFTLNVLPVYLFSFSNRAISCVSSVFDKSTSCKTGIRFPVLAGILLRQLARIKLWDFRLPRAMRPVANYPPQSGQKHDTYYLACIYQASKLTCRTVFVIFLHTDTFVDLW
jgi:hypothetical protein